jgi:receptor protein-tyrosine kinase
MVRELETPQDGTAPDARVVVEQRAAIPETPISPKPIRNLSIGAAFGLLLGSGLALLRDRLDNTVKSQETLEAVTGVGLTGAIPLDKNRRKDPAILFDNDNTVIAEAFRKLRTNLQFLAVDNPARCRRRESPPRQSTLRWPWLKPNTTSCSSTAIYAALRYPSTSG